MVINIAVCDNDQIIHVLLKEYFTRFNPDENISYAVSYFSNGYELLKSYSEGFFYHLVILDIEMPKLNGIDAAKKIQENYDYNVTFVFLTNYPENMHSNFSVQPCQYWIKPLSFNTFSEHMSFLTEKVECISQGVTFICNSGKTISLRLQDIVYIEKHISNDSFIFHTINSQYITDSSPLNSYEKLKSSPFISLTDDLIINLQHIKNFHKKSVELSNGSLLPLSSLKEKNLRKVFFDFIMQ